MNEAPIAQSGQRVLEGPDKIGNELRWCVQLSNGERALLVQLVPELAHDESVRRRYVYEAERLLKLSAPALAPTIAIGPEPDPRDPAAAPPWRLRADPPGETLAAWLERRAPAPAEEALSLMASVAEAVHGVHSAGAVLRDLEPRSIVIGNDGAIWLTDIGLARVDILSTRTASSLMLESSPYAAPEHLRSTIVDHRADVYTLGAMLWHAVVGEPPFDGGLLRVNAALPALAAVAAVSDPVSQLVASCLADTPDARPDSARDVAEVFRGRAKVSGVALERITCQACGARFRPGLRLCLACGKEAVQFSHVDENTADDQRFNVVLRVAKDDVEFLDKLRDLFTTLGEGPPPELNFLTGDARMYSKEERKQLISLPATLFADVSKETGQSLVARMRELGMKGAIRRADENARGKRRAKKVLIAGGVAAVAGAGSLIVAPPVAGVLLLVLGTSAAFFGAISWAVHRKKKVKEPMAALRAAPAALPASDPLVARVAACLADERLAADVREQVSELALLVQRLVDHRAAHTSDASVAMVTEPVEPLVSLIERELSAIRTIDTELAELDEGTIVRALAASEARKEPRTKRADLLAGLDRMRSLEDERSAHMQRLLEASSLVRRVVELGLSHRADRGGAVTDRELTLALAGLEYEI